MVTSRCCPSWVRPAVAEVQFHFEKVAAAKRSKCQSAGINPEIYRRDFDKRLSKKFDALVSLGSAKTGSQRTSSLELRHRMQLDRATVELPRKPNCDAAQ
jgi:hypothetical protein